MSGLFMVDNDDYERFQYGDLGIGTLGSIDGELISSKWQGLSSQRIWRAVVLAEVDPGSETVPYAAVVPHKAER